MSFPRKRRKKGTEKGQKKGTGKKGTGYFFLKKLPVPFFTSLDSCLRRNDILNRDFVKDLHELALPTIMNSGPWVKKRDVE